MLKKIISILITAALLTTMLATGVYADNKITFKDVDASSDMGSAIYKLANNGIINGMGDGTFSPNGNLTRAQLCKMINSIWKYTEKDTVGFKDVTNDKWYYDHVLIGKKAGYINGFEDGTFRGDEYVTREQVCAIICRVANLYDLPYTGTISDKISPWAEAYVKKVLGNGLMKTESGNKFRATENMKRGELAMSLSGFVVETPVVVVPGGSIGGGNSKPGSDSGSGSDSGNSDPTPAPPATTDYTTINSAIVAKLTTAKNVLISKKSTFTTPQQAIVEIVIAVLGGIIGDKAEYEITTDTIYTNPEYSVKIANALSLYSDFDQSGRSLFASKIKQLNPEVFESLKIFFGIDFSDIEDEIAEENTPSQDSTEENVPEYGMSEEEIPEEDTPVEEAPGDEVTE